MVTAPLYRSVDGLDACRFVTISRLLEMAVCHWFVLTVMPNGTLYAAASVSATAFATTTELILVAAPGIADRSRLLACAPYAAVWKLPWWLCVICCLSISRTEPLPPLVDRD